MVIYTSLFFIVMGAWNGCSWLGCRDLPAMGAVFYLGAGWPQRGSWLTYHVSEGRNGNQLFEDLNKPLSLQDNSGAEFNNYAKVMIKIQHSDSLILVFNKAHFLDYGLQFYEGQIEHFIGNQSLNNLLKRKPPEKSTLIRKKKCI